MNPRLILLILLAVVASGMVLFVVQRVLSPAQAQAQAQVAPKPAGIQVLVAAQPLAIGQKASPADFKWVEINPEAVAEGVIRQTQTPTAPQDYDGAVARVTIEKGEVIFPNRLVKVGDRSFMTALLDPGYRAVSVPISPETAAAGFILPNDRVDVILTSRIEVKGGENTSAVVRSNVIMADVKVLAIDQTVMAQVDSNGKTSTVNGAVATLALSPKDSESLAMAKQLGSLSLALRGLREAQPHEVTPITRAGAPALQQAVQVNSTVLLHAGGQSSPVTVGAH